MAASERNECLYELAASSYGKRPFAGPDAVLVYLSRYTHRVAISNRRLAFLDELSVRFR